MIVNEKRIRHEDFETLEKASNLISKDFMITLMREFNTLKSKVENELFKARRESQYVIEEEDEQFDFGSSTQRTGRSNDH